VQHNDKPGRPRDPHIDRAVLTATRELLSRTGYADLTIDAVAAAAGVGKPAIYRRYRSKTQLAFAAVNAAGDEGQCTPDTGSLRGDLLELARRASLRHPEGSDVILAVIAEALSDPGLATRLQQAFVDSERTHYVEVLERAHRRGELAAHIDPQVAHLLLSGPLFAALFVHHYPLDETLLVQVVTAVAAGLRALGAQPA
jgi:AcrR family transcriptional regulator